VFYLFGFQRQYLSFLYHRLWVTQWVSYKKQQQLILREYLLSPVFAAYPSRAPVVTRVCCLSSASTCCHPCLLLILREHLLSPVFAAYPSRAPVVTRVCCLSFASTCCHPCLLLILREHQCLFFSAVFCESVFVFSSISSSINGFWLPLWYL
jgi:hypothetical protein